MSIVLEDITTKIILDAEDKIFRGINTLQDLLSLQESQITPQQVTEIISNFQQLYLRVKQAPLLGLKLNAYREFQKYLSEIKIQYRDLLLKAVIDDIEELELQIQASSDLIVAKSLMLTAFFNHYEEVSSFKNFYESLDYLQRFVGNGNSLSSDAKIVLKATLENIISSDIFNNSKFKHQRVNQEDKEAVENYIKLIQNLTKAILWDIDNLQPSTSGNKFENINELWEYWDKTYSVEEMETSLKILEQGIDEERRKQDGRTLFS